MRNIAAPRHVYRKDSIRAVFPELHWIEIGPGDLHVQSLSKINNGEDTPIVYFFYSEVVLDSTFKWPVVHQGGCFWRLNDDRHDWIVEQGIEYALCRRSNDEGIASWQVGFESKADAAHFKMRWT
jgi:hypothetical protein